MIDTKAIRAFAHVARETDYPETALLLDAVAGHVDSLETAALELLEALERQDRGGVPRRQDVDLARKALSALVKP